MYKCLLVLASAAALKRPQRALKVRGGELGLNAETAITFGTGLLGLSGMYAYVDPKGNLEQYGITKTDASGLDNMRWAGAQQLTGAAILAADPEQAVGLSGYYAAWQLIASAPATLATGFPKAAIYGWAAVCAALGKKTLSGDVSPWALVAVWGLNGLQEHFMQDQTVEMYGANKQTKLGKSMFGLAGQQMICTATYLACLVKGKSQAEAFGISWAVGGLFGAKWAFTEVCNTASYRPPPFSAHYHKRRPTTSTHRRPGLSPGP